MAAIGLKNVSKVYGKVSAVADVSLEVRDGEFMILLGPSGCGKSTVLRMIAGLESVTGGEVHIGGIPVNHVAPRDRNIAVVFQNYALYPHMSVGGNLAFGLKMHGLAVPEIDARVKQVAALLGIGELLLRRPAELSGGQRQRVALGRALVREPVAFLLDEPLSNLDAQLRADMRLELVKLHRRLGRTILHVTHDQVEAMTMGERICIMRQGRVVQVGAPLEVYRNPVDTFVAGFLASPPMNLLRCRVEAGEGERVAIRLGSLILQLPREYARRYRSHVGGEAIFGIRPEDIHADPGNPAWQPFDIEVVALETLGAEVVLVGSLPGLPDSEIAARLDRAYRATPGTAERLYMDLSEMQLFDLATTKVIPRNG